MDPVGLLSNEWSDIGKVLTSLWIMVGLIVFVATNALISLIFIPSLVASFHLPPVAQKTRPLFYALAIGSFALAVVVLIRFIDQSDVIARIYEEYWI